MSLIPFEAIFCCKECKKEFRVSGQFNDDFSEDTQIGRPRLNRTDDGRYVCDTCYAEYQKTHREMSVSEIYGFTKPSSGELDGET